MPDFDAARAATGIEKRGSMRRQSTKDGGSPQALEATLAEISAEMTAEAIERLNAKKGR